MVLFSRLPNQKFLCQAVLKKTLQYKQSYLLHQEETPYITAHVLFSSSSQEERDNLYGKSKKEGREGFTVFVIQTALHTQI